MNQIIETIIENYVIIIAIACVISVIIMTAKAFLSEPTDKQLEKVRAWLIEAVQKAEEELGSGTGKKKLRLVYERFTMRFPWISLLMDFEMFATLVDEALDYVEGKLMEDSEDESK